MIETFFSAVVYYPIYNALAAAVLIVPYGDVGLAIVLITILVKLLLFPLALKASHAQHTMRKLEPELRKIRDENKDNSAELAKKTLALYSQNGISPFSSFLLLLIQIPVILGLYWVILAESQVGGFDPSYLYPFIPVPTVSSFNFLGLIPIRESSILLAIFVAISQYFQAKFMMPTPPVATGKQFQDDLASSMHLQVRYVLPFVLGIVSYTFGAAISLYFITSNLFGIMQEVVASKRLKKSHDTK